MTNGVEADTIAALATVPGEAAVAIIRISGPAAFAIADRIFACKGRPPSQRPARTFILGHVGSRRADGEWESLDQAILLTFKGPKSYTGEDVVELQVHGGRVSGRRILQTALAAGCRSADPGEFTKRAFLNNKIDLIQAEAVCDLIRAHSDRAAESAVLQLDGSLSNTLTDIYDYLASTSADVEATLDFPEEDIPALNTANLVRRLEDSARQVADLLSTWDEGLLLREGALVVIAGQPNVGKSTLMNRLLGRDRSIVTDIPGTTRDTIEESLIIDGVWLRLVDTAGIRAATCEIEREGIRRATSLIDTADYILYVVDGSQPLNDADREAISRLGGKRCTVVFSKADLGQAANPESLPGFNSVSVSLLEPAANGNIRAILSDYVRQMVSPSAHATISERHRACLLSVRGKLQAAVQALGTDYEGACVAAASQIRESLEELGLLTGRNYSEELLDRIFSRFCVGK